MVWKLFRDSSHAPISVPLLTMPPSHSNDNDDDEALILDDKCIFWKRSFERLMVRFFVRCFSIDIDIKIQWTVNWKKRANTFVQRPPPPTHTHTQAHTRPPSLARIMLSLLCCRTHSIKKYKVTPGAFKHS